MAKKLAWGDYKLQNMSSVSSVNYYNVNDPVLAPAVIPRDTRAAIVETARVHLRRFGQDKMTIVGIARALGMSHANVYRYFPSKTAIIDAVLDGWLSRVENFISEVANRPGSAAERVEAVVMELHRRRRAKFQQEPELYESFRRVIVSRSDAVARRQEKIAAVFRKLVEQGVAAGEFRAIDPGEAATLLEDSTAFFLHPAVMPSALNNRGEERARNVVRHVLAGFSPDPPADAIASLEPLAAHAARL
jgi:AcrR family transcriptional regulator